MNWLDLTLPTPAANLALDEALLLEAEERVGEGGEVLRFWEAPHPFVVLGLGNRLDLEVRLHACAHRHIPVLRRCSGGGTVLQGPGCLNYAIVLRIDPAGPLNSVRGASLFILQRHAAALTRLLERPVTIAGHTDLTLDGRKLSGNAQRRLRRCLLFHGTFLLDADLTLIEALLPLPSMQPDYRQGRSHGEFLMNLRRPAAAVKAALIEAWQAGPVSGSHPAARVERLVAERYGRSDWNARR